MKDGGEKGGVYHSCVLCVCVYGLHILFTCMYILPTHSSEEEATTVQRESARGERANERREDTPRLCARACKRLDRICR